MKNQRTPNRIYITEPVSCDLVSRLQLSFGDLGTILTRVSDPLECDLFKLSIEARSPVAEVIVEKYAFELGIRLTAY